MPKIIFTNRYIKNPASSNAGKLIKHMGTRDGVEKLPNQNYKSSVEQSVSGIVLTLAKLIANSCKRKRAKLFGQVDSKLKSKLEEKKVAHGLKTDRTVNQNEIENDEEQGFTMSM